MFCPNCKTEYRTASVKCPVCRMDLVEHFSKEYGDGRGNAITDSAGRGLLWSGLSRKFQNRICEALDAARIAHAETTKEFGLLPSTRQLALFIWVMPSDQAAARSTLHRLFANPDMQDVIADEDRAEGRKKPLAHFRSIGGAAASKDDGSEQSGPLQTIFGSLPATTPSDLEDSPFHNSLSMFNAEDDHGPVPDGLVENFDPAAATTQVWTGEDAEMAENLSACIRGVGVGCVVDRKGPLLRLFVLPASEQRAREVIQQVLDASTLP
jgi:hypothetical protein